MKKRNFICALCFLSMLHISAQSTQEVFKQANEAYTKGDFATAIQQYESLLAQGQHSEDLYYNLANAYYKTDNLGKAILNYERALLLNPKDENTLYNLAVAKNKMKEPIDPIPPFFLSTWWAALRGVLSPNTWAVIALVLLFLSFGALSLWQLSPNVIQKKRGFFVGLALLLAALLSFTLAWSAYWHQSDSGFAILLQDEASLKSGADEDSQELRKIYEGTKLELIDQINIWYKVRLQNGETGWLPGNAFEKV
ncbi:MAG TPA: tetratricopeptide repeat protein [Phaeodactylibacter sp.]|nr:tetratricopeptide repeat protein [Phaeodactylibacter sp.]